MRGIVSIMLRGAISVALSLSVHAEELKHTALSSRHPGRFESTIEEVLLEVKKSRSSMNSEKSAPPFITLTFAQSLDGKIALYLDDLRSQTSSNFPISGSASLLLTHALRSVHDVILIGGRTP